MNKNTTFTVVIPFFKDKHCLENIILLLKNQTKPVDEIIVVDDASTEDIIDIIRKFKVTYYRLNKNSGVAVARNKGLELSSSSITVFIDADAHPELYMIEAFSLMYKKMWDDVVGIGGRAIECRIQSKFDSWRAHHLSQDYGNFEKADVPFLFGVCCSYKTDILKNMNGFDPFFTENVGEDYDLGVRITKKGLRLAYSPNIVVNHQHIDSEKSIMRSQYLWSYWGQLVHKKNGLSTIKPWLGHINRIVKFSLVDFYSRKGIEFVCIGLRIYLKKLRGLFDAIKIHTNN